jgi:hypothetical protein
MHAEQLAYMPYPQLDGEESSTNESVYRNYPHPRPVAIEDLSTTNREILNSVSEAFSMGIVSDSAVFPSALYSPTPSRNPTQIIQGSRARVPERRGKTRRYAAIFDDKGLPLPSATGVVIGGPRSSLLVDEPESEMEPIIIRHIGSEKPTGFRALGRKLSSAARHVFTCHQPE